jgi:hypothetical protein
MGLYIQTFAGVPEVSHSGSTAGYRAFLTRYPRQRLSVAVLCNVSNGSAERDAHAVAAVYLGDAMRSAKPTAGGDKPALDRAASPAIAAWAGLYRSLLTGVPLTFAYKDAQLTIENGGASPTGLSLLADSKFTAASSRRSYEFGAAGRLTVANPNGTSETYQRVEPWEPAAEALKAFAGRYTSDEAETELKVVLSGVELKVTERPDRTLTLRPVYKDAFRAEDLGLVRPIGTRRRHERDAGARARRPLPRPRPPGAPHAAAVDIRVGDGGGGLRDALPALGFRPSTFGPARVTRPNTEGR